MRCNQEDPVVWRLLFERGRRTGDFALAARSKRELERLGIRVTYESEAVQKDGGGHCDQRRPVLPAGRGANKASGRLRSVRNLEQL